MMDMEVAVVKEYVRCSVCHKPVIKQTFCPRCGSPLIDESENPLRKGAQKGGDDNASEMPVEANTTEQVEKIGEETNSAEDERKMIIENELKETVEKGGQRLDEEVHLASDNGEDVTDAKDNDVAKTVPDVAKYVMDETNLTPILKEANLTEDDFLNMYKGVADDTHKVMQMREELIAEIKASIKDYNTKLVSVQQDMKLLNIRARTAALRRDIEDYSRGVTVSEQEASSSGNLEKLNDSEEIMKLMTAASNCKSALAELHVCEDIKGLMDDSMQRVLSLLKDTNAKQ